MAVTRTRLKMQANQGWQDKRTEILVNQIMAGQLNNGGEVTLTANAASTTLSDDLITTNSVIHLHPTTVNAAGALAGLYFDAPATGSVVINHANTATVDRTFKYTVNC